MPRLSVERQLTRQREITLGRWETCSGLIAIVESAYHLGWIGVIDGDIDGCWHHDGTHVKGKYDWDLWQPAPLSKS